MQERLLSAKNLCHVIWDFDGGENSCCGLVGYDAVPFGIAVGTAGCSALYQVTTPATLTLSHCPTAR
jgi:hypothetical protein